MMQAQPIAPIYVRDTEAAQILGVGTQHLRNMRCPGRKNPKAITGPAFVKLGKWSVRYKIEDLIKWADRNRVEPDNED